MVELDILQVGTAAGMKATKFRLDGAQGLCRPRAVKVELLDWYLEEEKRERLFARVDRL